MPKCCCSICRPERNRIVEVKPNDIQGEHHGNHETLSRRPRPGGRPVPRIGHQQDPRLRLRGVQAKYAALALALFTVPVTLIFHGFWHADAAEFQNQLNHFLKNVAIFGALLALFDVERQRETSAARVNVLRSRAA